MDEKRMEFVTKCGVLLNEAKPHLVSCELTLGEDIERKTHEPVFAPNIEYVVITCKNDFRYMINVTGTSLAGIAKAIFEAMANK